MLTVIVAVIVAALVVCVAIKLKWIDISFVLDIFKKMKRTKEQQKRVFYDNSNVLDDETIRMINEKEKMSMEDLRQLRNRNPYASGVYDPETKEVIDLEAYDPETVGDDLKDFLNQNDGIIILED